MDNLAIKSYPEGKMVFEGQGLKLYGYGETINHLVQNCIEEKDFIMRVEDLALKYTHKKATGTGKYLKLGTFSNRLMIKYELSFLESELSGIEYELSFLEFEKEQLEQQEHQEAIQKKIEECEKRLDEETDELEVLMFNEFVSDEHTTRKVTIPSDLSLDNNDLEYQFEVLDENHLFLHFFGSNRCFLFNMLTEQHRLIGCYRPVLCDARFVMLRNGSNLYHYNFSVDDMDVTHEPDIEQLDVIGQKVYLCHNADCICFANLSSGTASHQISTLTIFDRQRNRVELMERFPQLRDLNNNMISDFCLLTLTQDVLSIIFWRKKVCTIVHIENGILKESSGKMVVSLRSLCCESIKHVDLENSFFDEDCVCYSSYINMNNTFGRIRFKSMNSNVIRLKNLLPKNISYDGIVCFNEQVPYYFYLKEQKVIILRTRSCNNVIQEGELKYKIKSTHTATEGNFFVLAERYSGKKLQDMVKIHWQDSSSPIVTILPGFKFVKMVQGIPLTYNSVNGRCQVFLGRTMIVELSKTMRESIVYSSNTENTACIYCSDSIHFLKFKLHIGDEVEILKYISLERKNSKISFNPSSLVDTANDHQIFVLHSKIKKCRVQYLYCLDWANECFLEPVLLFKYRKNGEVLQGNSFQDFICGSHLQVDQRIVEVSIVNGSIETSNNDCIHIDNEYQSKNTEQSAEYNAETKSIVLKTNTVIETFHLPTFLAEADIFEYHMPDYSLPNRRELKHRYTNDRRSKIDYCQMDFNCYYPLSYTLDGLLK
ncbi:hypothetical protein PCE1_004608 [Barthelona sp. PCE]